MRWLQPVGTVLTLNITTINEQTNFNNKYIQQMTKYYLHKPIYAMLLVSLFFTSCNGQTKTQPEADSVRKPNTIPGGQSKIVKTQNTNDNENLDCGLQDKAGNLWFTTTGEGVYCYDGKAFTNYITKDGLCSNEILSILEDKNGNIWFGTKKGACRYDGKTFTNIPIVANSGSNLYSSSSSIDPNGKNAVWSMLQDKTGKIWFGTFDGVYCYNGKNFFRFLDNDGVINDSGIQPKWVETILEDRAGNIWFGGRTNEGAIRYDGKSVTLFNPTGEKWLRTLLQDKAGNIWFGAYGSKVFRYDGKNFVRFAEKEITEWVFDMVEDKDGNLWFTSNSGDGGVTCYNPQTASFTHFTPKDCKSNYPIWSIMVDNIGNIWFGTKSIGLCRYDARLNDEVGQGKTFTSFSE